MKRVAVGGLLVGAAIAVAGCTSSATTSGSGSGADNPVISPVSSPAPTSPAALPSTPAAAPTTPPASSASTSPTAPASPSSSAATSPVAEHSTCTKVSVRVIRGGAVHGAEIAALQFTNDGDTPCRLVGYPSVTLLLQGKPIGKPSEPSATTASARELAPGEVAESLLHNYTQNCQAQVADSVRVVVPGSTISAVRPAELRACVVRVDRLDAPE
jgi:hypothetical protein